MCVQTPIRIHTFSYMSSSSSSSLTKLGLVELAPESKVFRLGGYTSLFIAIWEVPSAPTCLVLPDRKSQKLKRSSTSWWRLPLWKHPSVHRHSTQKRVKDITLSKSYVLRHISSNHKAPTTTTTMTKQTENRRTTDLIQLFYTSFHRHVCGYPTHMLTDMYKRGENWSNELNLHNLQTKFLNANDFGGHQSVCFRRDRPTPRWFARCQGFRVVCGWRVIPSSDCFWSYTS